MAHLGKKSILTATVLTVMGGAIALTPAQASESAAVQPGLLEDAFGFERAASADLPGPVSTLKPIQESGSAIDYLKFVDLKSFNSVLVQDVESGEIVHQIDVVETDGFESVLLVDAATGEIVKDLDSTRN